MQPGSHLAIMWASYEAQVIPANAHETQRVETRRAFYAGAHGVLQLLNSVAETLSDDDGAAVIQQVHDEIAAFVARGGR